MKQKKILMVSAEFFPYARTGGLSEMVSSLSIALAKYSSKDFSVSIVIPFYGSIRKDFPESKDFRLESFRVSVMIDGKEHEGKLYSVELSGGVRLYLIRNDKFFGRDGLYGNDRGDYPDNAERFLFFSMFVARMVGSFLRPDIVHVHDWHGSLIPAILKLKFGDDPEYRQIKTLLTIHNLGYQGILTARVIDWAGFNLRDFPQEVFGKLEGARDRLNFLKTGIVFSDMLNTVSPTYAREIQTEEFGFGLSKLLRKRQEDLTGILNGVNYEDWDPATDPFIPDRYGPGNMQGKLACKRALSDYFGFQFEASVPIVSVIARLSYQKGLDLLKSVWKDFGNLRIRFVLLGDGDRELETFFLSNAKEYPERFAARIGFDVRLSHLIQAGSDIFLMPSRYEPCGLTQVHAMKYGTIPVVRATGGLEDTVEDFNETTGKGVGFKFLRADGMEMLKALKRATSVYEKKETWRKIMISAMGKDFSSRVAAGKYAKLYSSML